MTSFDLKAQLGDFFLEAAAAWEAPSAALFGASGSGKSTILEAMAGLRREVAGSVVAGGSELRGLRPAKRRLGWVPQDASLFPHMTARGNIDFAGRGEAAERAIDALELRPLLDRRAAALSGGERQRVAIARALASRPRLLLLDEPLASVDRPLRARIVPFLQRIPADLGVPMLLVSHDPHEVLALASHVAVLDRGRVVAQGDPRGIFASAAALGVLEALGAENLFESKVVARSSGVLSLETARGCRLEMASVAGFPDPARVAVRAEDIMLAARPPELVSAQNILAGDVVALEPLGDHVYVRIAGGGESWVAKVTPRAIERLSLAPGRPVHILIKAHAIHAYA